MHAHLELLAVNGVDGALARPRHAVQAIGTIGTEEGILHIIVALKSVQKGQDDAVWHVRHVVAEVHDSELRGHLHANERETRRCEGEGGKGGSGGESMEIKARKVGRMAEAMLFTRGINGTTCALFVCASLASQDQARC